MNAKWKLFLATTLFLYAFLQNNLLADIVIGEAAPAFEISSGDNQNLILKSLRGKVVLVFYETRDVTEKNRALKDALSSFINNMPEIHKQSIFRLPIINASTANWMTSRVWKKKFREKSKQEGLTVYGDWSGKVALDYGMKADESNVLLIDKKGVIRFFMWGEVKGEDKINDIKKLIKLLVTET